MILLGCGLPIVSCKEGCEEFDSFNDAVLKHVQEVDNHTLFLRVCAIYYRGGVMKCNAR